MEVTRTWRPGRKINLRGVGRRQSVGARLRTKAQVAQRSEEWARSGRDRDSDRTYCTCCRYDLYAVG